MQQPIKLPPRLAKIASLVPVGARVADVGTDHGYIPVWLVQAGICRQVFATDINMGPLRRAEDTAAKSGVEGLVTFLLCDGLDGCSPETIDTVIIAGMGGETIAGILERAPWTRKGRTLILQPMTKPERLREWLLENGYSIWEEHLAEDAGIIYPILVVTGDAEINPPTAAELIVGRWEKISRDPLFSRYLDLVIEKTAKAVRGLEMAASPEERSTLLLMREVLSELNEMKGRL